MTEFTPYQSLFGGVLIGLSAVALMLFLGRIMGATGILTGILYPANMRDWSWRAAVLVGMVSGPLLFMFVSGDMPAIHVPASPVMLVIGGFIVGLGVTFGSGCTSGHGVCGMARLSLRSIIATLTFMFATGLTVWIIRHLIGV